MRRKMPYIGIRGDSPYIFRHVALITDKREVFNVEAHTVKAVRLFNEMTQAEFAKRLGYAQSTIGDIEAMRKNPSDRMRASIAIHFPITDEFIAFLRNYEKLNKLPHDINL